MAYSNLSGTTMKSFKIGPNGVSLTSTAVTNGSGTIKRFLKTNQKDNDKELYLAYTDSTEPIYDTFIKSSEISSFSYTDSKILFRLRTGEEIELLQTTGDVKGPSSSLDSSIALFDGTDGKKIKDSATTISSDISTDTETSNGTVPTTGAVIGYVGVLSDALKKRLEGNL